MKAAARKHHSVTRQIVCCQQHPSPSPSCVRNSLLLRIHTVSRLKQTQEDTTSREQKKRRGLETSPADGGAKKRNICCLQLHLCCKKLADRQHGLVTKKEKEKRRLLREKKRKRQRRKVRGDKNKVNSCRIELLIHPSQAEDADGGGVEVNVDQK